MSDEAKTMRSFGWVLLELMGHRQRIGKAVEEELAGQIMLRIDIPTEGDDYATEFYGGAAIYAIRPISEDVALSHWANSDPRPPRPVDYRSESQIEDMTDDDDGEPPF